MKKNYSHLNKIKDNKFDYSNKLFKHILPEVAFNNEFTSGFLFAIQKILTTGAENIKQIKQYHRF